MIHIRAPIYRRHCSPPQHPPNNYSLLTLTSHSQLTQNVALWSSPALALVHPHTHNMQRLIRAQPMVAQWRGTRSRQVILQIYFRQSIRRRPICTVSVPRLGLTESDVAARHVISESVSKERQLLCVLARSCNIAKNQVAFRFELVTSRLTNFYQFNYNITKLLTLTWQFNWFLWNQPEKVMAVSPTFPFLHVQEGEGNIASFSVMFSSPCAWRFHDPVRFSRIETEFCTAMQAKETIATELTVNSIYMYSTVHTFEALS